MNVVLTDCSFVDRLLTIWQIRNTNVPDQASKDPLIPFHTTYGDNPKTDSWTSDMAHDWTRLNYQYDDLAPKPEAILPDHKLDLERYISDLDLYIQQIYPGGMDYVQQVLKDVEANIPEFFGPQNAENNNSK